MLKRFFSHLRSRFFFWNVIIMLIVSLLAGFLIVTHGRPETYAVLIHLPGLIPSSFYSGLIAFMLLIAIYIVSFIGNARYAGRNRNGSWLTFQLIYGVVVVIMLELLLATILFWIMGFWILESAFFDKVFLLAILFILVANLAYLLFYMQRVKVEPEIEIVEVHTIRYQPMPLVIKDELGSEERAAKEEAALFYIRNGEIWRKTFIGKREIWLLSIEATMSELDPSLYFKCARNWIVHRDAVASVKPISSRRLEIYCHFKVSVSLVVSRRNAQDFKDWFYGDHEPSDDEAVHS